MRHAALLGLLFGLGLLSATGCKTARAATPVEVPNLEVPPPPARVYEPPPPTEPPQPELVSDLPPTSGSAAPKPRPPRDPAATKPETKPDPALETTPVVTPPPPPAPQLRAPGLASGPETAGAIRAILDRATGILSGIDYRRLTKPRQDSYDTAKRFAEEGEKELKAANYVLAKELAEKAERLARELQNR